MWFSLDIVFLSRLVDSLVIFSFWKIPRKSLNIFDCVTMILFYDFDKRTLYTCLKVFLTVLGELNETTSSTSLWDDVNEGGFDFDKN